MEAIKFLEPYFLQVRAFLSYARSCIESDMHAAACRDFWTGSAVAALVLALVVMLVVGTRVVKEQLEFRRNKRRLAARAIVAADETMNEHKWRD
jgi:hypothetical protein